MSKKKYSSNTPAECRISTKDNPEQAELARLIRDNSTRIIFGTGNAGTGKTFITIYTAYNLLKQEKYAKILYSRDAVQLGAELGFLPGDIADKFDPFLACLTDNLESIERLGGPKATEMLAKIEKVPITFLRGRNLENCILIIDEAQNLDLNTLHAILTRLGEYSKVVLLGSSNQIDNKYQAKKSMCDFDRVMQCLSQFDFVGQVHLVQSKRSKICAEVDEALLALK